MERARQSDTWTLATAEARPWLLMMWATAWEQTPCGSMPNDDELIAARIGMPLKTFTKFRPILLRKWWLADDGRLYHDVLVQRVMEMMQTRRKESDRKALARARNAASVPQDSIGVPAVSHGTTTGLPPESDTGTGTGTNLKPEEKAKPARERAPIPACPDGVTAETWRDWLALRKAKRAPVSETVIREAQTESVKAGMTFDAFLRVWCVRGSQGLQADWLKPHERGGTVQPISRFIKGTSLDPDFRGYEDHATAALR